MFFGTRWRRARHSGKRLANQKEALPRGRFRRTLAQIQIQETGQIIAGRVFLHDLSPEGVGVFLSGAVARGDNVSIVISKPRAIYLRGTVVWCALYANKTRVLSVDNFRYRARIHFLFDSQDDRAEVAKYCESIAA